ncbi:MAG: OmpH family outer membrane protein [Alistipes sp.]|jgi:outer membrane protein|nr:OmpH family outer membrane protein [Alistipes sp.]MBQ6584509.1 OmpH family outer membrane protein [Alistipes sp.]MBR2117033.1 OmpH family outer membrane protein [Alistipes sp.]MEE0916231.1 OmpH family outer membrane protein [Alistipes sp.]
MKKIFKLTLVLAMVISSTSVYAQKLARVNFQEIFALMPETKEMQTNLEAFSKELQEQLEAIQVEFNNRYAEFEKAQATMNPTVKQMKQAELNGLQQRYAEFNQIAQQDFAKKQQELAAPIQEKLDAAIAKVAKAGGYAAVFDSMGFVYHDDAQVIDLNGAVKKELGITDAPAQ